MSLTAKRTLAVAGVLAVIAAVIAPRVWPLLRAKPAAETGKTGKAEAGKGGGATSVPIRVTAVTVVAAPLDETIAATGTLRAEEGVDLQPETNGKVVSINFTEGAQVRRGDLLLKLNDSELRAMLQRAAYRRELAELKERRLVKLLESNSVNQQDYDAALSDLSVQRAEVALVEAQIAKMEIRAPFDGVIGLRFVSEGAFVTATTRVATLQQLDNLKVDFAVPEKYAARIRLGSPIVFTVAGGNQRHRGQIYALDPRIDAATRTVLIRALCPNPGGALLPGAFASVEFTLGQVRDALLVPAVAVVPGLSEKNVFVVRDGKAVRTAVQTGMRTETSVQITAGLTAGDIVITSGLQLLRAGQRVVVASDDAAASGSSPRAEGKPSGAATPAG